jgi:succinate dehydrogenase/fumarate reductase-like Fe-S protein
MFQDLTNLYDHGQYQSIEPWLQRKDSLEKDGKKHFQSVEDRKKLVR